MKKFIVFSAICTLCICSVYAQNFTKSYMCFGKYSDNGIAQVPPETVMYVIFSNNGKHLEMGNGTHWEYTGNGYNCMNYRFVGSNITLPPGSIPQYAQVSNDYNLIYTYEVIQFPGMYPTNIQTEWRFCGDGIANRGY